MTRVRQSPWKAGGGRRGNSSHTQLVRSQPSAAPPLPSLLLKLLGRCLGEAPLAALCPSMLSSSSATQQLGGLLIPARPSGHRCCSGWPLQPSPPPHSSRGSLSHSTGLARKQTSLFLLESGSRNRVFPSATLPPSSPSAKASQVLCHQPGHSSRVGLSQAPN